jgi:GAF domain-containing protein
MPSPIPSNEADRLAVLRDVALCETTPQPVFDRLTRLAAELRCAPVALISLIDGKRQWLKSRIRVTLAEITQEPAFCAYGIMTEDILAIRDTTQDARFRHTPLGVKPAHVRLYAATAEGLAVGAVSVMDRTPRDKILAKQTQALCDLAALNMALVEVPQRVGELL